MVPEGWIDTTTFDRNRDRFPPEKLRQYAGRHVAWSMDGTEIVADGATFDELIRRLEDLGIDPTSTVPSFVHDPDTSYI